MDPSQRAKLILNLCAHELSALSVGHLQMLESAIHGQIKDAIYEALEAFKKKGNKTPTSQPVQNTLITVRKRAAQERG